MTEPASDSILDLVGPLAFRVSGAGEVAALTEQSAALLAQLPGRESALIELFGLAPAEPTAALRAQPRRTTTVTVGERRVQLRWDVLTTGEGEGCVCVAVDWQPLRELLDRLQQQTLQFKEIALNILPSHVVSDLLARRVVRPRAHRRTTILFADVVDFSKMARQLDPVTLLRRLDAYFTLFDDIAEAYSLVKVKTSGDAYLCVGGIPERRPSHAVDVVLAALAMRERLDGQRSASGLVDRGNLDHWHFRFGAHSGPCITGVVGRSRHFFDIWGDAVSIAAQVEAQGEVGQINVSGDTRDLVEAFCECSPRGPLTRDAGVPMQRYVVERLRAELAADEGGLLPGPRLFEAYRASFYPEIDAESLDEHTVPALLRRAAESGSPPERDSRP
ncbi:MAG: adenylate/guanylate cyclase domain-containing protein [Myxococcales bacterium]|nr:adenylate/guanylate cyclase domain-containing protein [Myxococcales bacterium]